MSQELLKKLPIFVHGTVVKGFGRGSKDLGVPTGKRKLKNNPSDVTY
jgi:FAD synthase